MSKLMKSLNEIDDDYIIEALDYKAKKKKSLSFKIVLPTLVCCSFLFLLVLKVPTTKKDNIPSNQNNLVDRPMLGSGNVSLAKPMYTKFDGKLYMSDGTKMKNLAKNYHKVGEILETLSKDKLVNYSSTDCHVGDLIYASDDYSNIYIYTKLNDEAMYYRFSLLNE